LYTRGRLSSSGTCLRSQMMRVSAVGHPGRPMHKTVDVRDKLTSLRNRTGQGQEIMCAQLGPSSVLFQRCSTLRPPRQKSGPRITLTGRTCPSPNLLTSIGRSKVSDEHVPSAGGAYDAVLFRVIDSLGKLARFTR